MNRILRWRHVAPRGCLLALIGAVVCAGAPQAQAQSFTQVGVPRQGRLSFNFFGASMADSQGLDNGVNCLRTSSTARLRAADLPTRPTLVSATLYIGGSLFDDGVDIEPSQVIFDGQGRRFDNPDQREFLETQAIAAADRVVEFRPPGADAPVTVSTTAQNTSVSLQYISAGSEQGNVGFFVSPIDVTEVIRNRGEGVLAGDYTVSGLQADLCNGFEAICDDPPDPPTCGTESSTHTKGAASWALLLIVEDPALPLSSISIFEGLQSLANFELILNLAGGFRISDPAAGSLAFYALEGDLGLGAPSPGVGACNANEYIEVVSFEDADDNGLPDVPPVTTPADNCLVDVDNPEGNLFNSSINTQPRVPIMEICNRPAYQCCPIAGVGLCGETGVDIDAFDISSALTPNDNGLRVRVGTASDQVALATLVLGVDVFEPVLNVDSQIRILSEQAPTGEVRLGGPLILSMAISNTGNVDAQDVSVIMNAPPLTFSEEFQILSVPPGATDLSAPGGGTNGTGVVDVQNFDIAAGEIAEIRVQMVPACNSVETDLRTTMDISSAAVPAFSVDSPPLVVGGPGVGACEGLDPEGPFSQGIVGEVRRLGGGGGCAATPAWPALLGVVWLVRRRRRGSSRHAG